MRAAVIVLALVLAGCGGAATVAPRATPAPTPVVEVVPEDFTPPPEEIAAKLGEAVPLINTETGDDLGTVTVIAGKRYTKTGYFVADKGRAWIGVKVRYAAVDPFDYSMFDWVAHDGDGNQYQLGGFALSPELMGGTLAKGRKVDGWIAFEVPAGTKALWADYAPGGGAVIFSVKVYPAK